MQKDIIFLFDWGGIIESMEQWAGNWTTICKYYGKEDCFPEMGNDFYAKNFITETTRDTKKVDAFILEWLKSYNVPISENSVKEFKKVYFNSFKDNYINEELIGKIKELKINYSTGIFSNVGIMELPRQQIQTENYSIFDKVYLSCDLGVCKPDYKIYSEVEKEFKPENIYYFDDIMKNVLCARNKGWNAFCPRCEKDTLIAIEKILKKIS